MKTFGIGNVKETKELKEERKFKEIERMKNKFRSNGKTAAALVLVTLLGIISWCLLSRPLQASKRDGHHPPKISSEKTTAVKVVPLEKGYISETVVAYGTVIPAPGGIEMISVPFETQIQHIFVSQGERVTPGTPLLEVAPSPDSLLNLDMARTAYKLAEKRLAQVKKRQAFKLATNREVLQAEQAFREARLRLKNLEKRGLGKIKILKASGNGIVGRLYVREGTVVPAGGPLVEIITRKALEVRLGVEPEDVVRLKPGEKVALSPVIKSLASRMSGTIKAISRTVNPSTRLVDVFVVPTSFGSLLLNEYLRGEITIAAREALLAPRSAVLPEGDHYVLFTIKNGRAKKHLVEVGIESGNWIEITGHGLQPGDQVVILGNYELKDGMAVRLEGVR